MSQYVSVSWESLHAQLKTNGLQLTAVAMDLIDKIWEDRPSRPNNPLMMLGVKYTGKGVVGLLATSLCVGIVLPCIQRMFSCSSNVQLAPFSVNIVCPYGVYTRQGITK